MKTLLFFCRNVLTNTQTRTAAEAESRAKGKEVEHNVVGCFGAIGKGEFIHNLPIDTRHKLHSNVTPNIPADNSAEALHAERVPLSAQKKRLPKDSRSCHIVPNHRTFIDDYLKIVEFIEWLKVAYPEKVLFLTKKS